MINSVRLPGVADNHPETLTIAEMMEKTIHNTDKKLKPNFLGSHELHSIIFMDVPTADPLREQFPPFGNSKSRIIKGDIFRRYYAKYSPEKLSDSISMVTIVLKSFLDGINTSSKGASFKNRLRNCLNRPAVPGDTVVFQDPEDQGNRRRLSFGSGAKAISEAKL